MKDEVQAIISKIDNVDLRKIVSSLIDENEEAFYKSPAACGIHHEFEGGLAVHLTSTARTALSLLDRYYQYIYDRHNYLIKDDVVIAGALLHDIGKVRCYREAPEPSKNGGQKYISTEESVLFHHIPIGYHMVASAIEKHAPDLPCKNDLLHIIISHHGRVEWNSPRPPKTIEAFLVHQADYIDAHVDVWGKNPRRFEYYKDRDGRAG